MTEMSTKVFQALLIKLNEGQDTVSCDEVAVFERLLAYDYATYREKTATGYTGVAPTGRGTTLALTGVVT